MSSTLLKSINIQKGKVFLTVAASNVHPIEYQRYESVTLENILVEKGIKDVIKNITVDVIEGNYQLRKGNKFVNLLIQAREAFSDFTYKNTNIQVLGEYITDAVFRLEKDPNVMLDEKRKELFDLKDDRNYIIKTAKEEGKNLMDYSKKWRTNKSLALELIEIAGDTIWFSYPKFFVGDKDVAFAAVKKNGAVYRELTEDLKKNRQLILEAYSNKGKRFHEFHANEIPMYALLTNAGSVDVDFMKQLIGVCPSLKITECTFLLANREVALEWCKIGDPLPFNHLVHLPSCFMNDKEFQDVIIQRCKTEEEKTKVLKYWKTNGINYQYPYENKDYSSVFILLDGPTNIGKVVKVFSTEEKAKEYISKNKKLSNPRIEEHTLM